MNPAGCPAQIASRCSGTALDHGYLAAWPLKGDTLRSAVEAAVETGYRAFDTAQMYANEAELGDALAASGLTRDQFCVTTKVKPENFPGSRFMASVEGSLKALRLDRVDVLLLHWPPLDGNDLEPTLKLLEETRNRGLASNIGVSNFTSSMMRTAKAVVGPPLAVNQVEFHALLNQEILLDATHGTGIPLSAYCSLARGGRSFGFQNWRRSGVPTASPPARLHCAGFSRRGSFRSRCPQIRPTFAPISILPTFRCRASTCGGSTSFRSGTGAS